ncbi:hypothetical protein JMN32_15405 [Fulvivirga sp. 29W222]|uniref:STAS/SEC14 domain-containing protein n=1 Tax=Fulvivirga marina TaxID=2494733 RepID=A0A937FX68_9BACT|nr:hypothetical protein [Fulvivirga marina]MBL6447704.1 hypothetical protein [Fulvivirga marina]
MKDNVVTRLYATNKAYFDFDPSVPCIIAGKLGFVSSEEFIYNMQYGLKLFKERIKEHSKLGWVANLNQANVYDAENVRWVIEHWNPAAIEAGLKYIAFIEPESDFVKESIEKYTKQSVLNGGLVINSFSDVGMAKTWLRSQLFDDH